MLFHHTVEITHMHQMNENHCQKPTAKNWFVWEAVLHFSIVFHFQRNQNIFFYQKSYHVLVNLFCCCCWFHCDKEATNMSIFFCSIAVETICYSLHRIIRKYSKCFETELKCFRLLKTYNIFLSFFCSNPVLFFW